MEDNYEQYFYSPYYEKPVEDYVICWRCGSINLESMSNCHICNNLLLKEVEE